MLLVNPTFGQAEADLEMVGAGEIDWAKEPIVLFSNSKPNATELLTAVAARLQAAAGLKNAGVVSKGNAAMPAPPTLLDEIASRHRVALLAIAD